jgi:hypothetical protein
VTREWIENDSLRVNHTVENFRNSDRVPAECRKPPVLLTPHVLAGAASGNGRTPETAPVEVSTQPASSAIPALLVFLTRARCVTGGIHGHHHLERSHCFWLSLAPGSAPSRARSQAVSFNQLHQCDHSRVKQVLYYQAEDKPVSRSELVKGFEYVKDRYVVVEERELDRFPAQFPRSGSAGVRRLLRGRPGLPGHILLCDARWGSREALHAVIRDHATLRLRRPRPVDAARPGTPGP